MPLTKRVVALRLVHRQAGHFAACGALYHHFAAKTDLFRAIVKAETNQLREDIAARTANVADPGEGLLIGTKVYFASMNVPGRCQLLLVDGPAVLGPSEMLVLHEEGGRRKNPV